MKITVLIDNKTLTDLDFPTEPALSLFIEHNGMTLLFDTGYSDTFIGNAERMGLDLRRLDYVVLSHGHYDHIWGLSKLAAYLCADTASAAPRKKPTLIAHPHALEAKRYKGKAVGCDMPMPDIERVFSLGVSKQPIWLTDEVVFLGEIPKETPFEPQKAIGEAFLEGKWAPDYVLDDTALVLKHKEGLVIVTGCSHAGICNIVAAAQRVTGERRIYEIIGGFHLENVSAAQMDDTVASIANSCPRRVHACHCTGLKAQIELSKAGVDIRDTGAGLVIDLS